MNTQELLQPFCAVNDIRYYLNHIFKKGDYLCASNGHVFVRVPDDGTVEIHPETKNNNINIDNLLKLESWSNDGFIPLEFNTPDVVEQCNYCNSSGKTPEKTDCYDCDGDGWFKHGDFEYDCQNCDGTGRIDADSEKIITCEDCQGTGIKYQYLTLPDGRQFNYQYLLKLKALPGIVYAPDHSDPEYGAVSMRFKFENGLGLLMPVRK
ncbi:MAG: hypothetical protein Q8924_12310 [Bacillota bacterium]|nr:hypothetical protein [Bacillota bacterium]